MPADPHPSRDPARQPPPRARARPARAVDRSLARERTLLAWNRSALSVVIVAALVLRVGTETKVGAPADILAGVLVLVAGAAYAFGRLLYLDRVAGTGSARSVRKRTLALRLIALSTQVIAVAAFFLAFPR